MSTTSLVGPAAPSLRRDEYRFGDGPTPVLRPGTFGWSESDLEDAEIERLWLAGRYEILDGVLTVMPAAFFQGGEAAQNLVLVVTPFLRGRGLPVKVAAEVDIRVRENRVVRADVAAVIGADLIKLRQLRFAGTRRRNWKRRPLTIPPTLVIESVRRGHEEHDRETKRLWYAEFGVPNYWLVDGYERTLDCLALDGGVYRDAGSGRGDEAVCPAAFAGLSISLADIWGDDDDDDDLAPTGDDAAG